MARIKLETTEEQAVKSAPTPTPAPKAKATTEVSLKKTSETPEETRLAPKGVSDVRERKLMSEPVYDQGEGVTKKTISQRSVIIEPKKSTLPIRPQASSRAQTPPIRSTLVADARAEQARTITDVRASAEVRRKCSQSCQERFGGNAAKLGECVANCI